MFKKRLVVSLLALAMVFSVFGATAFAEKVEVSVQVDGKTIEFPDEKPYFDQDSVMIPVRFVSEALGAEVEFEKYLIDEQYYFGVRLELNGTKINMPVNSKIVEVGDRKVQLKIPSRFHGYRVYVPIRFVSEALGAEVKWDAAKKMVIVTTGAESKNEE
ncbi:hypothetical protein J2Z32_003170 [Paenibacillus turicensis]|uniref:Copper amine oxidase-like N-terminal domain-containing protein n=1 Tax=Paenibacillus turicensis TaxID=160487 RepID=A0ABS4FVX6_9BACL|nr:copper amine oxidase N-terminal domain-containing protein [Paenibacillus turicensis]MBP1906508.1 hypothetical protein [Paenibacillus turicensis]